MFNRAYAYFVPTLLIEPQRQQLVLPAFILPVPAWGGASSVLAEYPFNNVDPFSLKLPINPFGENFILAVRTLIDDIYVRFKLFDDDDAVLNYPLYSGQQLGPNTVLEVWSVNRVEIPHLDDDYTFYSSLLVFPPNEVGLCNPCCTNSQSIITLVQTPPSTLPPGSACNPFCGNLCNTEPPMPVCDCPIIVKDTVEDLRDYTPDVFPSPMMAHTFGGATSDDGYGKMWKWVSTSLAVDDGTAYTVVVRPNNISAPAPGRWIQDAVS